MLSVNVLVHSHTPGETSIDIPQGVQANEWVNKWVSDVIDRHTVLFGPSLCLTMLAIGAVAWALARRQKHFELGIVVGFVGVVYALSQIYVYQNGLLVPFLRMGAGAKLFLIGWRILFVTLYWFVMLAIAGITVPGARVVSAVSAAIATIASIVSLVSNLLGKR